MSPESASPCGPIAILGAGPAGLTAALLVARGGREAIVFEAGDTVGGLAKTVRFGPYSIDLGGHRFFTKVKAVESLWEELLGSELLTRPRLSRIYHEGRFYAYPLEPRDLFGHFGLLESARCAFSYARARLRRGPEPETFEEWVTDRFGRRLYERFFRSYTEKVWGIPGSEIRSEWAAQRIRNLTFGKLVRSLLGLQGEVVPTLIEEFRYPRLGPGQMWETVRDRVAEAGVPVLTEHRAVRLLRDGDRVTGVVVRGPDGEREQPASAVLSSIPLSELVLALDPPAPEEVLTAARSLRYRDLCVVALTIDGPSPFPDTWIYLQDPGTGAGRVQNYGAWSEAMVETGTACLGVEYFCFAGDPIWEMPEADAVAHAVDELARIGLLDPARVTGGKRIRVEKSYPTYDASYREAVAVLRAHLSGLVNLQTFGRNGLHRYNNQDHSMWTAALAAANAMDGGSRDVWSVNTDALYAEEWTLAEDVPELAPPPRVAAHASLVTEGSLV